MRGVIGAGLIILGLAGGYLILTGKFPPSSSTPTATTGTPTTPTSTPSSGPSVGGGAPTPTGGATVTGLPTMANMSDQTIPTSGGITA